jgi:transcriptional regulator with XRE-family HTH domain
MIDDGAAKGVMYPDNASTGSNPVAVSPQTLYRGLYGRVARKLGVDPSYVSRVARGERQSPEVEAALSQEIGQIARKLGSAGSAHTKSSLKDRRKMRLKLFVEQRRNSLRQQWLQYTQADPNIRRIKLPSKRRLALVTPVVEEALNSMKLSLKEVASKPMKAASRHGKERREQGYTPTTLLEEYNLIRRCIHNVAQQNLKQLDPELLLHDLGQLGEVLDLQSQHAIRGFLGQA